MSSQSPFADDWRECLRAHYVYVARANDTRTLESLTGVLHQVGFGEDELGELYMHATMHVDDVRHDFTPDMTVVAAMVSAAASPPSDDAPAELIAAAEAAAMVSENPPEDEAPPSADDAPLEPEPEAAVYDPEGPQQMNLF